MSLTHIYVKDFPTWQEYYWKYQFLLAQEYYIPLLKNWNVQVKGKKVLDIGCGNGGFTAAFGDSGADCVGVEIRDFNWKESNNVTYKVQDILSENAVNNLGSDYDIIILRDVIEHILLDHKFDFLSSLKSFANPDTVFLITFPLFYSPFGLHQQTFLKSFLKKLPFLGMIPNIFLLPILHLLHESEEALNNIIEIKKCKMTNMNFIKLMKSLSFKINQKKFFTFRPSHEIRLGWRTRISPIGNIPLLNEIFVLGTVYLASLQDKTD